MERQIELPKLAIDDANSKKLDPSELWCKTMLEKTGIRFTPGTAFGQIPDSYYFKISFVQPFETLENIMDAIKQHHLAFIRSFKKK